MRLPAEVRGPFRFELGGGVADRAGSGQRISAPGLTRPSRSLRRPGRRGWGLAAGIVRIQVLDFLRQLTTFRTDGGTGEISRTSALARFGAFFLGSLWDVYGGRLLSASPI